MLDDYGRGQSKLELCIIVECMYMYMYVAH